MTNVTAACAGRARSSADDEAGVIAYARRRNVLGKRGRKKRGERVEASTIQSDWKRKGGKGRSPGVLTIPSFLMVLRSRHKKKKRGRGSGYGRDV